MQILFTREILQNGRFAYRTKLAANKRAGVAGRQEGSEGVGGWCIARGVAND